MHHLTRPLRAAATQAGDTSVPNLWAGTGWRQLTVEHLIGEGLVAADAVFVRGGSAGGWVAIAARVLGTIDAAWVHP